MIKIVATMEPVPFKRTGGNGRRRYNDPRYTAYKAALSAVAKAAMRGRAPLTGEVRVSVKIFRPKRGRQFGDLDNHVKAVLDALNGICYVDDSQVTRLTAEKFIGDNRVEVNVRENER